MKSALNVCALLVASPLFAQTAQTSSFRAILSSAGGDSGSMDLLVHAVKDSSGNILSGSIDFNLAYRFVSDEVVTGLSVSIPATVFTALMAVQATAGSGRISSQAEFAAGDRFGLAMLNGLLTNPGQYSVGVITAGGGAGTISGPLQPANSAVLMALLNSSSGSGAATAIVTYTGAPNAVTSAEVAMQVAYQFPAAVTFSGMRIYAGQGASGAIEVAADLMPGTPSASGGTGVLAVPATEIDMTDGQSVQAVQDILLGPTNFSVGVDTVENSLAPLTGQLRATDFMAFQIPAFTGPGAASQIGIHTLRLASGDISAGTVVFDVNYRLVAGEQIAGMDVDGTIMAPAVSTDVSGSGNAYAVVSVVSPAGVASLNSLVDNPQANRIDLTANGASTMSTSLASASAGAPAVAAVIPIVEVKTLSTFAPGELVEIYGTNLAQETTDLTAWPGGSLPTALNGVSVKIGGQAGRILYVSPNQVDAEFAFETPTGTEALTLTNAGGTSAPISVEVTSIAPALYNFAFENTDFSMISQSNPASAGDVLVFYSTGMGQTQPALTTGQSIPLGPPYFDTPPVAVTIGGVSASVIYSIAAPPYVTGLYQMAVTVPGGLPPGNQAVIARSGGVQSNAVTIVTR